MTLLPTAGAARRGRVRRAARLLRAGGPGPARGLLLRAGAVVDAVLELAAPRRRGLLRAQREQPEPRERGRPRLGVEHVKVIKR